jgi:hypothetical protein
MKKEFNLVETREELKKILYKATQCDIQHDGWSCGTCFFAVNDKLTNMDWQTILAIRGDYLERELDNLPKNIPARVERIKKLLQS